MDETPQFSSTFDGLMSLVGHLRSPAGCPWDRDQTRQSLRRYLLEECYELLEAIDEGDAGKLVEEMGDVLFHLAFHIQLGKEEGSLTEEQVFRALIDKLVRRHPHVFGDKKLSSTREVESNWHAMKREEQEGSERSILGGVPGQLPALSYAQGLQDRAAGAGFDWEEVDGVLQKVMEELNELNRAQSDEEKEAELGDLLFSIVNVGRWLGMDVEGALHKADARFRKRFGLMEQLSRERGIPFVELPMDEKEALWQKAKSILH